MKICMVISTPFPPEEGIGYYVYNLSQKLIEKGHEIVVITRGSLQRTQWKVYDGIEVIKAPFVPLYPFYLHFHGMFINKILKSLESQLDIIHIHSPLPPYLKTSLPIISTIHTPMLTDANYYQNDSIYSVFSKISAKYVSYPTELKNIKASNIITTVSKSIAQELGEYSLTSDEIQIIGNAADIEHFIPRKGNLNFDQKYILFVGRIDREKGIFDLLESGKNICNKRSDVTFFFVGKGKDLNTLKQKIEKYGLQEKFKIVGQVDKNQLVKYYQNATLFVLPSYHEGLPAVLLEAMSCGVPVIATDVRGNRDIITHEINGLLVPQRNPKKLGEAISLLLDDEKLRKKIIKNSRKSVLEKYNWDTVGNKMLKCYEKLVGC